MEGYQIIAFAPNDWCGPWMNRQQILSRIAESFPVLYSTGTWHVWDRHSSQWRNAGARGRVDSLNGVQVETAPKYLMRWPRVRVWDAAVLWLYGRRLRRLAAAGASGPVVAYVFHPRLAKEALAVKPDVLVYHAYDLFSLTPGWREADVRREQCLIERSDLVIASSEMIARSLSDNGAKEVAVIPNGADYDFFSYTADKMRIEPDDLKNINRPRIGYTGNLNRKVDIGLVYRLASQHRDFQFVFVGGFGNFDDASAGSIDACRSLPNVHFLGNKHHERLPEYMACMDVNIMCYRISDDVWTSGIYPLKLHEYLAVGKPVVSARLPAVEEFSHVIGIADDDRTWEMQIQMALDGNGVGSIDLRRRVARNNSWNCRVKLILERLAQLTAVT